MSTDLHERTTNPSPDPQEPEKPKPALSFTQVVGGALAAMTAAALGSRLSVAGTLVGAALASVIAAVAGSIYTSSLRRTHQRVSAVWQGRSRAGAGRAAAAAPAGPEGDTAVGGTDLEPDPDATRVLPRTPARDESSTAAATAPAPARRRIGWKPVVVGALLMFAIAAVALTGIELVTGHALSGGTGTTISRVADGPSNQPTAPTEPAASASPSSRPTATPSATPTTEPTAAPSPSATAEPSASASPSATPSASPVPSASEIVPGSVTTS